jgi:hypothetical protein
LYPAAELRYGMPVLPALAVITAWWVCSLKNLTARTAVFAFLMAFACLQFGVRTFSSRDEARSGLPKRGGPDFERMGTARLRLLWSDPRAWLGMTPFGTPKQHGYALQIDRLMARMDGYISPARKLSVLNLSLAPRPFLYEGMLNYYLSSRYENVTVHGMNYRTLVDSRRILADLDFIIVYAASGISSWREIETEMTQGGQADPDPLPNPQMSPRNLSRSPRGLEFTAQLSREFRQFGLLHEEPLPFERHWLVFKRRSLRPRPGLAP